MTGNGSDAGGDLVLAERTPMLPPSPTHTLPRATSSEGETAKESAARFERWYNALLRAAKSLPPDLRFEYLVILMDQEFENLDGDSPYRYCLEELLPPNLGERGQALSAALQEKGRLKSQHLRTLWGILQEESKEALAETES